MSSALIFALILCFINRNARWQVQENGKSRVLSIRKCTVEESARIAARTNVDESASELIVKCK